MCWYCSEKPNCDDCNETVNKCTKCSLEEKTYSSELDAYYLTSEGRFLPCTSYNTVVNCVLCTSAKVCTKMQQCVFPWISK